MEIHEVKTSILSAIQQYAQHWADVFANEHIVAMICFLLNCPTK